MKTKVRVITSPAKTLEQKAMILFNVGDIVKLKDDGDTEFIVLFTKKSGDVSLNRSAFDYAVKKMGGNRKDGEYLRLVFKENLYKA